MVKEKRKSRRATVATSPDGNLPAASETRIGQIGDETQRPLADPQSSMGERGHKFRDAHNAIAAPPADTANGSGGGPAIVVALGHSASPDPIAALKFKQAQRVHVLRSLIRMNNSVRAFARVVLRWEWTLPEPDREQINAAAAKLVDEIEAGEIPTEYPNVVEILRPTVLLNMQARSGYEAYRKRLENEMRALAESLPVYASFVAPIRGLGSLGLAIIVGEAGDIGGYANPGKLWKRMGLAPDCAYAMTTASGATAIAKPRRRRSAMFTVGDSLIKGNGDGEYKKIYEQRREYEVARNPEFDNGIDAKTGKRKVTMHCHRRAQRYMEKRLLRNLWRAWRAQAMNKAA